MNFSFSNDMKFKFSFFLIRTTICLCLISQVTLADVNALSLKEVMVEVLEGSPRIEQSKHRLEQQLGLTREINANGGARIAWVTSMSQRDDGLIESFVPGVMANNKGWSTGLRLNWELYSGGRQTAEMRRGDFLFQAAQAQFDVVIRSVMRDAHVAWVKAIIAREEIRAREETYSNASAHVGFVRKRAAAGKATELDRVRAESMLAETIPDLTRARNQFRIAQDRLMLLMGREPGLFHENENSPFALNSLDKPTDVGFETNAQSLMEHALTIRPELIALHADLNGAKQGIPIVKALNRPSLHLSSGYSAESARYHEFDSDPLRGWDAGLQLQWTLFDHGRSKAKFQQIKSKEREILAILREQKLIIKNEVSEAIYRMDESLSSCDAYQQIEIEANTVLKLAKKRFESGVALQLDVLDAENRFTRARINHIRAIGDLLIAQIQLRYAAGLLL